MQFLFSFVGTKVKSTNFTKYILSPSILRTSESEDIQPSKLVRRLIKFYDVKIENSSTSKSRMQFYRSIFHESNVFYC
jgi:hypothetical protein